MTNTGDEIFTASIVGYKIVGPSKLMMASKQIQNYSEVLEHDTLSDMDHNQKALPKECLHAGQSSFTLHKADDCPACQEGLKRYKINEILSK